MATTKAGAFKVLVALGIVACTLGVQAAIPPAGWLQPPRKGSGELHAPVASDATEVVRLRAAPSLLHESAVEPAGEAIEAGTINDYLADVPASVESTEELWKLWSLPPASGSVGAETIIWPDNRTLVSPTTTYPARAVALITFDGGRCTGWLYGRDIVATAGHCVHSGGSGGSWRTNVRVYPGRNGSSSPFGSCTARRLYSVTGWTTSGDETYDYGAIKLNCSIGTTTGWFGYFWQSASLTGLPETISGYPGDKPLTQWKATGSVGVTQARQVFYQNDSVGGMSGGPVFTTASPNCSGQCSMAIHAYGLHGGLPHARYNHGTRITSAVFNNLYSWKYAP